MLTQIVPQTNRTHRYAVACFPVTPSNNTIKWHTRQSNTDMNVANYTTAGPVMQIRRGGVTHEVRRSQRCYSLHQHRWKASSDRLVETNCELYTCYWHTLPTRVFLFRITSLLPTTHLCLQHEVHSVPTGGPVFESYPFLILQWLSASSLQWREQLDSHRAIMIFFFFKRGHSS